MKSQIEQLFNDGDSCLREATSESFLKDEVQGDVVCNCCKAIKKYLGAYVLHLYSTFEPSESYHSLVHVILQKDADFRLFIEKIFAIKCFAEEARLKNETASLDVDDIKSILKDALEIRNYIASKIRFLFEFIEKNSELSFMST